MNAKAMDAGPSPPFDASLEDPAHVVVIAGSAGALTPLKLIVKALPPELDAAVLVVVHYPTHYDSVLPQVLARSARLPVARARDGERMKAGRIYVAPSGRNHLVIEGMRLRLRDGVPVHRHIPAADPLFASAASSFGPATIGVVLSGADTNGAAGLQDVKAAGGIAVVQLPREATFDRMPKSALASTSVDLCAPSQVLAERIVEMCGTRRRDQSV